MYSIPEVGPWLGFQPENHCLWLPVTKRLWRGMCSCIFPGANHKKTYFGVYSRAKSESFIEYLFSLEQTLSFLWPPGVILNIAGDAQASGNGKRNLYKMLQLNMNLKTDNFILDIGSKQRVDFLATGRKHTHLWQQNKVWQMDRKSILPNYILGAFIWATDPVPLSHQWWPWHQYNTLRSVDSHYQ